MCKNGAHLSVGHFIHFKPFALIDSSIMFWQFSGCRGLCWRWDATRPKYLQSNHHSWGFILQLPQRQGETCWMMQGGPVGRGDLISFGSAQSQTSRKSRVYRMPCKSKQLQYVTVHMSLLLMSRLGLGHDMHWSPCKPWSTDQPQFDVSHLNMVDKIPLPYGCHT